MTWLNPNPTRHLPAEDAFQGMEEIILTPVGRKRIGEMETGTWSI